MIVSCPFCKKSGTFEELKDSHFNNCAYAEVAPDSVKSCCVKCRKVYTLSSLDNHDCKPKFVKKVVKTKAVKEECEHCKKLLTQQLLNRDYHANANCIAPKISKRFDKSKIRASCINCHKQMSVRALELHNDCEQFATVYNCERCGKTDINKHEFKRRHSPCFALLITVQKLDKHSREVLATYDSLKEAGIQNNISASNISNAANPEKSNKTAGGYTWNVIKQSASDETFKSVEHLKQCEHCFKYVSNEMLLRDYHKLANCIAPKISTAQSKKVECPFCKKLVNRQVLTRDLHKNGKCIAPKISKRFDKAKVQASCINCHKQMSIESFQKHKECERFKTIQKLDKHTLEVLATYDSLKSASIANNIKSSNISTAANPEKSTKTAGGYAWKII